MKQYICIDASDNVATMLIDLKSQETLIVAGGQSITALQDIPYGHKIALRDIPAGGPVIKYGVPVAIAEVDIHVGEWVHIHNCNTTRGGTQHD